MEETWKPVVGVAGYEVSDRGRVRGVDRVIVRSNGYNLPWKGSVLKPWVRPSGHLSVKFGTRRGKDVHLLVLEAFVGPCPEGQECRHINGDPADNRWPENIEWASLTRNRQDRKYHKGRAMDKITPEIALAIKLEPRTYGYRVRLARRFKISVRSIKHLMAGDTHTDVKPSRDK